MGALSLLKHSISKKAKLQLVNGLIVSRLAYIISIWGNTSESAVRKAQVCLNTSARFVLNANKYTRETDLMIGCNWLNVRELMEYFSIIQLWKDLRWNAPAYIRDKFSLEEEDILRTDIPRLRITREGWRTRSQSRTNSADRPTDPVTDRLTDGLSETCQSFSYLDQGPASGLTADGLHHLYYRLHLNS